MEAGASPASGSILPSASRLPSASWLLPGFVFGDGVICEGGRNRGSVMGMVVSKSVERRG
jgi:hypothetical protein